MKKGLLFLLIAVIALSVIFVGCKKKEEAVITVATDATWPPMEYVDANKNIVGFDIDLGALTARYPHRPCSRARGSSPPPTVQRVVSTRRT